MHFRYIQYIIPLYLSMEHHGSWSSNIYYKIFVGAAVHMAKDFGGLRETSSNGVIKMAYGKPTLVYLHIYI